MCLPGRLVFTGLFTSFVMAMSRRHPHSDVVVRARPLALQAQIGWPSINTFIAATSPRQVCNATLGWLADGAPGSSWPLVAGILVAASHFPSPFQHPGTSPESRPAPELRWLPPTAARPARS